MKKIGLLVFLLITAIGPTFGMEPEKVASPVEQKVDIAGLWDQINGFSETLEKNQLYPLADKIRTNTFVEIPNQKIYLQNLLNFFEDLKESEGSKQIDYFDQKTTIGFVLDPIINKILREISPPLGKKEIEKPKLSEEIEEVELAPIKPLPAELQVLITQMGAQENTVKQATALLRNLAAASKLYQELIRAEAIRLIDYLSNKFNISPYYIAFKLGSLAKNWFVKKKLIKEEQALNLVLLNQLKNKWLDLGTKLHSLILRTKKQDLSMKEFGDRYKKFKELLQKGADPNFQDTFYVLVPHPFGPPPKGAGYTALMNAIFKKNGEMLSLLLEHGVNPNIKDKEGKSALDHALIHWPQIAETLRQYTKKFNEKRLRA